VWEGECGLESVHISKYAWKERELGINLKQTSSTFTQGKGAELPKAHQK